MSNPYQSFSCQGSTSKGRSYKPKITPKDVVDAVPKTGYISRKQLAKKLNVSACTLSKVLKDVELGVEIEMFEIMNNEQSFKRVSRNG
jgi:ribosomal protein S25